MTPATMVTTMVMPTMPATMVMTSTPTSTTSQEPPCPVACAHAADTPRTPAGLHLLPSFPSPPRRRSIDDSPHPARMPSAGRRKDPFHHFPPPPALLLCCPPRNPSVLSAAPTRR